MTGCCSSCCKPCCKSCCKSFSKSFASQFQYSKLWLFYHDWKAFTYTPWLPYKWQYQALYLVYRWFLAIYFFSWLIVVGVVIDSPKFFIFLTLWSYLVFNLYLIVAAISSTTKYLSVHFLCPIEGAFSRVGDYTIQEKPRGCCGYMDNKISWYQMLQWLLFTLATDMAFGVMILYWTLLYRGGRVQGGNVNVHLINGLFALADLWISGVPVNMLHFIYPMIFTSVYAVFSGIYFRITGEVIYPVLEYGDGLAVAVVVLVVGILVLIPLAHVVVFYLQYLARFWILHYLFEKQQDGRKTVGEDEEKQTVNEPVDKEGETNEEKEEYLSYKAL